MKKEIALLGFALLNTACMSSGGGEILSEQFIHKYGFQLSPEEWQERAQDGQVVTKLGTGVVITSNYERGKLHGNTSYTFPHSTVVEKIEVYDQGTLLKEILHDLAGMPVREEAFEFDDRKEVTFWDTKGSPLSVEKYEGNRLVEGYYYTPEHELEGKVQNGRGERVKRDRTGLLLSKDTFKEGVLASRISFHPNGQVHTISHYDALQLHGKQDKFTSLGRPLLTLHWDHGILDGSKVVYRNGMKVAEIPYVQGKKEGTERHYDDLGNLIAEMHWHNDLKHGKSSTLTEDTADHEWYFSGKVVSQDRFEILEERKSLLEEMSAPE